MQKSALFTGILLSILMYVLLSCGENYEFSPQGLQWPEEIPRFTKVAVGEYTGLALDEQGNVWSWGFTPYDNHYGKSVTGAVPVWTRERKQFGNIRDIFCFNSLCMAIDNEGYLWAWGDDIENLKATLPPRDVYFPKKVVLLSGEPLSGIKSVSISEKTVFALTDDGTVYGWGSNITQQLGKEKIIWDKKDIGFRGWQGNDLYKPETNWIPHPITVIDKKDKPVYPVKAISSARYHILVLTESGEIWGWGSWYDSSVWTEAYENNDFKAMKKQKEYLPARSYASDVIGDKPIRSLQTNIHISAALLQDGRIITWGNDEGGAMGHGSYYSSIYGPDFLKDTREMTPVKEDGFWHFDIHGDPVDNIQQTALLRIGIFMLDNDGRVIYQGSGYPGNGDFIDVVYPSSDITPEKYPRLTEISPGKNGSGLKVKSIWTNRMYTAFCIDENGVIWSWGKNEYNITATSPKIISDDVLLPQKMLFYRFNDKDFRWELY